jgi:hypothetical protein
MFVPPLAVLMAMLGIRWAFHEERQMKRYLVVAAITGVGAFYYFHFQKNGAPRPVDFSFSLECRELEGAPGKPLMVTIDEWEKAYAEAKRGNDWSVFDTPMYKGIIHEDRVRFAYVHGKPDGGAVAWLYRTYVSEVTAEIIVINGGVTPIGPLQMGLVDRRTGHAGLSEYNLDIPPGNKGEWEGVRKKLWKEYTFECEPSKPAKF